MKKTKGVISIFLVVLMLFSSANMVFAVKETKQTCPVIFIPGFSSSEIYADVNDESTLVSFPGTDSILTLVKETLLPALVTYSLDRDTDKFAHKLTDGINEMFRYWFNESTGETKKGSGVIEPILTDISTDSRLIFGYDWRGDPLKIAESLNSYIENVCKLSGSEKVALGCHSLGSTVALAYLTKYGNERISGIVFDSPACNGVALIGNVLTGKVNLDADSMGYFLKNILGQSEYEKLISAVIDIFEVAGVFELFSLFADELIELLAPIIYKETVAPLVGCWLTIWSMLPDSDVEEAKSFIFDEMMKDTDTSVIEAKIDLYNSTVRAKRTETLKNFNDVGNFAIFSRYANETIPLTGSAQNRGDLIIETAATSFGATTAYLGDYFSDEYIDGKDMDLISPDRTVDASTCLFPEQTWFIKNSGHFETGGLTEKYYDMFLFAEDELTCDTAEIGRFTICDKTEFTLEKDTTSPQRLEKPSALKSIYNLISALLETIQTLIKNFIA